MDAQAFPTDLDDPDNPENRNAGNGGDLVKHAVYLALLRHLGPGMRLRECHAGRGLYRVPATDPRRDRLARLFASSTDLARTQRGVLARVGLDETGWYAGSALLCAHVGEPSLHEAYEWDPRTRAILRHAARAGRYPLAVVDDDPARPFDGESLLADRIGGFGVRDLVLLDPFGLWRHRDHAFRRARYHRLLAARADPPLAIFFTWGRDARGEAADLEAEKAEEVAVFGCFDDQPADDESRRATPPDGYGALRARIAAPLVRVRWHCDLRCAMWVAVAEPRAFARSLAVAIGELHREVIDDAAISVALTRAADR